MRGVSNKHCLLTFFINMVNMSLYAILKKKYGKNFQISSNFACSAWMQYYLLKKRKKEELERKMAKAAKHHAHRMMRKHLEEWTVSGVFLCNN